MDEQTPVIMIDESAIPIGKKEDKTLDVPIKKEGRKCVYGKHAERITVSLDPQIVVWVNSKKNRSKFVNEILRIEKEKEENAKIANSGIGTKLLP